jgi:hypothetical protein
MHLTNKRITTMEQIKTINFDEQLKKIETFSEITVRDKVFKIYRFPAVSTILYNDFVNLSTKAFKNYEIGVGLLVEIEKEKNKVKKERLTTKLKRITDNPITEEQIVKKLYDCLKWFLSANGYKFNLKWWQEAYTDVELTQFIHICSNKDNIDAVSKKKA